MNSIPSITKAAFKNGGIFAVLIFLTLSLFSGHAEAEVWADLYNPDQFLTLHFELNPTDWITIQNDETFELELPAMFWIDGEEPILVGLQRKSGDPLTEAPGYTKVSLKVDINEFVDGQSWHELKKLSLENGDDEDVVSECLAWYVQRLCSSPAGYNYPVGLASWVQVIVNGVNIGVYVNVEQPDKQFLKNRNIYTADQTWLYKMSDINSYDLKVGTGNSPTYQSLCYQPFHAGGGACASPDQATFTAELFDLINMRGMLTQGAMDAFLCSSDALFTHGKNAFFVDFLASDKRMYLPWDLDSAISGNSGYYPTGDEYADYILAVPEFLDLYEEIFNALLAGPLTESNLHEFLNSAETLISSALEADPNNQIGGSVAGHFSSLREWVTQRIAGALDLFSQSSSASEMAPKFRLELNYPNPFNNATRISYELDEPTRVSLRILDISGRLVRTLDDSYQESGRHSLLFDGRNEQGISLSSGVYYYILDTNGFSTTHRMVLGR